MVKKKKTPVKSTHNKKATPKHASKKVPATKKVLTSKMGVPAMKKTPKTNAVAPVSKKKGCPVCAWLKSLKIAPLATLGPIGYFPKGSGTIGSLVALPIAYFLGHFSVPCLWVLTLLLFFVGIRAIDQYTQKTTEKDPGCVIIDEVVGQLIPFAIIIPDLLHWPILLFGFVLFRFFDIIKFGSVAMWDRQKTPMGVMMDDVEAGLHAAFVLALIQIIYIL